MKITYTETEIKDFFTNLLCESTHDDFSVEINSEESGRLEVKVNRMYDFVPNGFQELKAIGEFFETDKVNGSDRDFYSGCETCDYGSSYSVTFVIEE